MEPAQRDLIQRSEQVLGSHFSHRIPPPLRPVSSLVGRLQTFSAPEDIRLRRRAADFKMNGR
jgi:hypothetical protein